MPLPLSPTAQAQLDRWRRDPVLADQRADLDRFLADADAAEVEDAFGAVLPFGTAGRRGREGVGPNRINRRTIAESAAGLLVLAPGRVVVGYDGRRQSRDYALLTAEVLLAGGCRVDLFDQPCATPQVAHAVATGPAGAGVMITASHNPPEYNGFKAYGAHGGQLVPPDDARVMAAVLAAADQPIAQRPWAAALADGTARWLTANDDDFYLGYVADQAEPGPRACRLVYSPLQGVGTRTVPRVLALAGFAEPTLVSRQAALSAEFEELPAGIANPEWPPALDQVIEVCRAMDADAGLASDPDADRIGLVARDGGAPGGYRFFRGHELAALIVAHTLARRAFSGRLPANSVVLRSVVGSRLIDGLCARHGVGLISDLPIGFKWCGELQPRFDDQRFVAAVDESHGYNRGALVRDKDAASAALALAEIVADCVAAGQTVGQRLSGLQTALGPWHERVFALEVTRSVQPTELLEQWRRQPPATLAGQRVVRVEDRLAQPWRSAASGLAVPENFLLFHTATMTVALRPSGTEPKLKWYVNARGQVDGEALEQTLAGELFGSVME